MILRARFSGGPTDTQESPPFCSKQSPSNQARCEDITKRTRSEYVEEGKASVVSISVLAVATLEPIPACVRPLSLLRSLRALAAAMSRVSDSVRARETFLCAAPRLFPLSLVDVDSHSQVRFVSHRALHHQRIAHAAAVHRACALLRFSPDCFRAARCDPTRRDPSPRLSV